jgi:NTP pyrophosphatase (non-canonical NTP hydrolase)
MSLQAKLRVWLIACLGEKTLRSPQDRAMRVLEEAVELAQAVGIPRAKAREQVDHTYSRPLGEPTQEVAGVLNATLLMAECLGEDGLRLGDAEVERAWAHIDLIRRKNLDKVQP